MTDEERIRLGLSHPFECNAELVGGPDDGFCYGMIRRAKPHVGTIRVNDGKRYRLLEFKNGVAMFHFIPYK